MNKQNRESKSQRSRRHSDRQPVFRQKIIFGIFHKKNGQCVVIAKNVTYPVAKIKNDITIDDNTHVKALIKGREVVVLRAFGPKLTIKEMVARLIDDADVPVEFSSEAIDEANSFGDVPAPESIGNRLDLRKLALCTIDGESAKDFDDAVFARPIGKNIEVIVAIADVSHYVKEGSHLDQEAALRGTSIYYPGYCIPMLPEQLSNGLCSLKPNVERLALAVCFELGPKGRIFKAKIKASVIKSAARLTYNQVQDFYDKKTVVLSTIPPKVKASLCYIQKAAHILRKQRERRGAIDFDLVESVVALDDVGEPIAIHPQDRLDAHRVIEDLMVATNEIVADVFERRDWPCLYRVHEAPDPEKLENFFKTAHAFGALDKTIKTRASSVTEPKALQDIMMHYQKSKFKETLHTLMLRSMMQARYSDENLMHFGLASEAYLHFTSPIRRYADLIVHRQIRYLLFEKNYEKKIRREIMAVTANSISQKEVKATELERKIDRIYSATFIASHIGETFDAVIVSCTEFGFFVRITEHHVEGLVHIATISRSHVNFVAEKMSLVVSGSNERFMVGDNVRVKLINVNVERGHVDFELATEKPKNLSGRKSRQSASDQ